MPRLDEGERAPATGGSGPERDRAAAEVELDLSATTPTLRDLGTGRRIDLAGEDSPVLASVPRRVDLAMAALARIGGAPTDDSQATGGIVVHLVGEPSARAAAALHLRAGYGIEAAPGRGATPPVRPGLDPYRALAPGDDDAPPPAPAKSSLRRLRRICRRYGDAEWVEEAIGRARAADARMGRAIPRVCVIGMVGAGKSKLVNALLRRALLYSDHVGGTADSIKLRRVGAQGEGVRRRKRRRAELQPLPLLGEPPTRAGRRLVAFVDHPLLERITLVDTPGLRSTGGDEDEPALRELERADAWIHVVSAGDKLVQGVVEDWAAAQERCGGAPGLLVLTKCETRRPEGRGLREAIEEHAGESRRNGWSGAVCACSAELSLLFSTSVARPELGNLDERIERVDPFGFAGRLHRTERRLSSGLRRLWEDGELGADELDEYFWEVSGMSGVVEALSELVGRGPKAARPPGGRELLASDVATRLAELREERALALRFIESSRSIAKLRALLREVSLELAALRAWRLWSSCLRLEPGPGAGIRRAFAEAFPEVARSLGSGDACPPPAVWGRRRLDRVDGRLSALEGRLRRAEARAAEREGRSGGDGVDPLLESARRRAGALARERTRVRRALTNRQNGWRVRTGAAEGRAAELADEVDALERLLDELAAPDPLVPRPPRAGGGVPNPATP